MPLNQCGEIIVQRGGEYYISINTPLTLWIEEVF